MLKRLISTSVLVVLVGSASGANAFTGPSDKRTYFTFSQPVALPGVTLPAGTYMFRLADDTTTRKVIQVANKEGTRSFAMLHTVPINRPDVPRDPEIRFMETAAGAPIAVRAWWKDGERTGYGFIYSKEELAALNRSAAPKVESRDEATAIAPREGPLSGPDVIDGPGVPPEDVIDGPGVPPEEPEQIAQLPPSQQAPPPPPPAQAQPPAQSRQPAREELPRTASPLALLLLGGVASASLGARLLRKS
jgi:hypothetical protein